MNGDPYCYDNGTLRNRFGITDAAELALVEHDHSAVRLAQLGRLTLPGGDDLIHLQGFHRHIFQDVYDWAGEIRTLDIAKGDHLFCAVRYIESAAADVFRGVPEVRRELGHGKGLIPVALGDLYGDINALHPFREGNGRAQRAYFSQLCRDYGTTLDWSRISPAGNIDASIASHRADNIGMFVSLRVAASQPVLREHARWEPVVRQPAPGRPRPPGRGIEIWRALARSAQVLPRHGVADSATP